MNTVSRGRQFVPRSSAAAPGRSGRAALLVVLLAVPAVGSARAQADTPPPAGGVAPVPEDGGERRPAPADPAPADPAPVPPPGPAAPAPGAGVPVPGDAGKGPDPQGKDDKGKGDKSKGDKSKEPQVKVAGQIFVRNTVRTSDWNSALELRSARVAAKFRNRKLRLRGEVDVELAEEEIDLKDVYVRVEVTPGVEVRVGRFKRPIGAVALASRWELPTFERGLLSDLELGNEFGTERVELPVGGRGIGVAVDVELCNGRHRATLGVFRSPLHDQVAGSSSSQAPLRLEDEGFVEDLHLRYELAPVESLRLGAALMIAPQFEVPNDRVMGLHRVGVTSVDAVLTAGALRLWAELFYGANPLPLAPGTTAARGAFWAGRTIAALRVATGRTGVPYLEPYVAAQYLDASDVEKDDTGNELGAGLHLGFNDQLRLQLGVDRSELDSRLGVGSTRLQAQLSTRF